MRLRARGLLVLAAVTVAGCAYTRSTTAVVVGDSIGVLSSPAIHDALDDVHVVVDAVDGATIAQQRRTISRVIATRPDALVIELGTNDMTTPLDTLLTEVDDVLDEASDLDCVAWVPVRLPTEHAAALNDHLRAEAAGRTNLHIVDWIAAADGHPDWFQPDGVHPNAAGQAGLAAAIADTVRSCVR